mmetsp:Transcript_35981/g.119145  ORF Transcript_35981/g.119145 Transcript_35981/m.119145 type:complete len:245 (+) Transcript_35981:168-902(+)
MTSTRRCRASGLSRAARWGWTWRRGRRFGAAAARTRWTRSSCAPTRHAPSSRSAALRGSRLSSAGSSLRPASSSLAPGSETTSSCSPAGSRKPSRPQTAAAEARAARLACAGERATRARLAPPPCAAPPRRRTGRPRRDPAQSMRAARRRLRRGSAGGSSSSRAARRGGLAALQAAGERRRARRACCREGPGALQRARRARHTPQASSRASQTGRPRPLRSARASPLAAGPAAEAVCRRSKRGQ